ncbi:hypothetical protein DPEC_G00287020 [Dallia pectoralis]|uniref:Uncharacterized protein n=1 Tax=Dallia pectoralis TaxID=75939 RepID=A0ACC2FK93_DALPE|nr:hypothetical protein DPEC_G00287020 [Dallia pectoralis]
MPGAHTTGKSFSGSQETFINQAPVSALPDITFSFAPVPHKDNEGSTPCLVQYPDGSGQVKTSARQSYVQEPAVLCCLPGTGLSLLPAEELNRDVTHSLGPGLCFMFRR